MLEEIFELQDRLNNRFGASQRDIMLSGVEIQKKWVDNFMKVMIGEAFEVQKATGARWWKADKDYQGMPHVREELIDCLHFLVSAMLAAGMRAEDVLKIYRDKNARNNVRDDWKINSPVNESQVNG